MRFTGVSSSDAPDAALRPMLAVDFERAIALGKRTPGGPPLAGHARRPARDPERRERRCAGHGERGEQRTGRRPGDRVALRIRPGRADDPDDPDRRVRRGSATLSTTNDASLPDTWLDVVASDAPHSHLGRRLRGGLGGRPPHHRVDSIWRQRCRHRERDAVQLGYERRRLRRRQSALDSLRGGWPDRGVVTVQLGGSLGSAVLTASDDAAVLGAGQAQVALSTEPPVRYEIHHPPFRQLGAATLGAATDQVMIAWQTITRETGGPTADRFELAYRLVGDPTFVSGSTRGHRGLGLHEPAEPLGGHRRAALRPGRGVPGRPPARRGADCDVSGNHADEDGGQRLPLHGLRQLGNRLRLAPRHAPGSRGARSGPAPAARRLRIQQRRVPPLSIAGLRLLRRSHVAQALHDRQRQPRGPDRHGGLGPGRLLLPENGPAGSDPSSTTPSTTGTSTSPW